MNFSSKGQRPLRASLLPVSTSFLLVSLSLAREKLVFAREKKQGEEYARFREDGLVLSFGFVSKRERERERERILI